MTLAPAGLDPRKFRDPDVTAGGEQRAQVALTHLETLWFNTGTLCNLTCANCYIESSPRNDRLAYLTAAEVSAFLDEIEREGLGTREIGFTGGEPLMNPDILDMLEDVLGRGFECLVLTNAMRPMMKRADGLLRLCDAHGDRLAMRVSIDHYEPALHEEERGPRSWAPMVEGLRWLSDSGFHVTAAGRTLWGGGEDELRAGFARLFADLGVRIDAADPGSARDLPGDGCLRRRAGDHHRLLGDPRPVPRRHHVRLVAHGGQAQGSRRACRALLHPPAL